MRHLICGIVLTALIVGCGGPDLTIRLADGTTVSGKVLETRPAEGYAKVQTLKRNFFTGHWSPKDTYEIYDHDVVAVSYKSLGLVIGGWSTLGVGVVVGGILSLGAFSKGNPDAGQALLLLTGLVASAGGIMLFIGYNQLEEEEKKWGFLDPESQSLLRSPPSIGWGMRF